MKGWSEQRRREQALRIQRWRPWERSTGPRTPAGKQRACQNALKHGSRSAAARAQLRELRKALRQLGLATSRIHGLRTSPGAGKTRRSQGVVPQ